MSKAWAEGSTSTWRQVRTLVLTRDRWVCQLCWERIDSSLRPPHPRSASVHHTMGRDVTGDDPAHLVAAHLGCNLDVGDPTKHDPAPMPATQWGRRGA